METPSTLLKPITAMGKKLVEMPEEAPGATVRARMMARAASAREWFAAKAQLCTRRAQQGAAATTDAAMQIASDRSAQVTATSGAGGAVVVGAGGAAVGLAAGAGVGAAFGAPLALLTFGLSIPVGAVIGGSCGVVLGGAAGASAGLVGAGAAGYGAYTRREQIGAAVGNAQVRIAETLSSTRAALISRTQAARGKVSCAYTSLRTQITCHTAVAGEKAAQAYETAHARATSSYQSAMEKLSCRLAVAGEQATNAYGTAKERATHAVETTKARTADLASAKAVQVTAASAAGGAIAMGTSGAATGLFTGGAVGAAVGIVPAVFTFGLSIPVFAMVGSGCGLVAGTAVGGAAGLVGGGATGYGAYTKREAISGTVTRTMTKVDDCTQYAKEAASSSASYVRARLVGGTGGTAD